MRRFARPWVVVVVLLLFALGMCSDGDDRPSASPPDPSTTAPQQPSEASTTPTTPAELPSVTPTTQARPAPDAPSGAFAVRSVTDGDTLTVDDGRRVRLAQVDAPETNECFGAESTLALRALVDGQRVELRQPSNGPERDRYGRTLAEVSVAGVSVNEQLVRDGAAEWYEEFASEDADLAARLRAAERDAQSAGKGLWSGCTIPAPSAPTPREDVNAATPSGPACHPGYRDACIPPSPPDLDSPTLGDVFASTMPPATPTTSTQMATGGVARATGRARQRRSPCDAGEHQRWIGPHQWRARTARRGRSTDGELTASVPASRGR